MDKLEKQKKEQEQQQKPKEEGQKRGGSKGDQKDEQQDKPGEKDEKPEPEKKEPSQGKQAQGQPRGQEQAKQDRKEPSEGNQAQREETPRDLSGELAPMKQMDEESGQDEKGKAQASAAMIDRKKAEALLDNVQEDRSRFLQYQLSKEQRRGPQSGKDW